MPTALIDGAALHYEVEGDSDRECVLLIPGIGLAADSWAGVAARVIEAGYRTVIIEPRGSGRSSPPAGALSSEGCADDAIAVLDHAAIERAHVVGLSMGGMIAQQVAIRHPKRVTSLVLTSTYGQPDEWSRRIFELRRMLIESFGLEAGFRFSSLFVFSPELFREQFDFIAARESAQATIDQDAFLAQIELCLSHSALANLGSITAPTLVIAGERDMLASAVQSRELAEAIPGARLELVPNATHAMVWDERAGYPDRLLAFLVKQAKVGIQ
jgi:pimeloyl-ACP methyl ester carboxylesterase